MCEMCTALIGDIFRLRRANKILRLVNGMLRRQESEAVSIKNAMGELWGSGEFDCGPQDHSYMVEQSIAALRSLKAAPTPR